MDNFLDFFRYGAIADKKYVIGSFSECGRAVEGAAPHDLDDREDHKENEKRGFWCDAEYRDEVEEKNGNRCVYDQREREGFHKIKIIAEAAKVIKSCDIENDDPRDEDDSEGDKMGIDKLAVEIAPVTDKERDE